MFVFFILEVADGALDRILGLLVVLVLPDRCGQVVREVIVDHLVYNVGEGSCASRTQSCFGVSRGQV